MPSNSVALLKLPDLSVPREVSKRRHIYDLLLSRIKDRTLPVGTRLPSASALAEEWQVAYATVHAALNELTRGGWLVRNPRQGTFVSEPPKRKDLSLFSKTISVALPPREDIASAGYGLEVFEMLQGLTEGARDQGLHVRIESIVSSPSTAQLEVAFESMRLSTHVIFIGMQYRSLIKRLSEEGISVTTLASDPKCGNVISYDRAGSMRTVVDHLYQKGYRKIAFLGKANDTGGKYSAYQQAVLSLNLEWNEDLTFNCHGAQECREQIQRFLNARPDCDAIIIPNYQVASAFFREAVSRRISFPNDLALISVGIDDKGIDDFPISYLRIPYLELGVTAVNLIFSEQEASPDPSRQIIALPGELIARATT